MPEKMPTVPLSELANFTMGQSPDSAHVNGDERGLPFLQGCAEFGARHPSARVHCFPPLRIAKTGSILISVRAPVGTMNRADKDYCIGRGLAAILAKAGVADDVFLASAIEQNISHLHRRSQGSTFLAIGSADLNSMSVAAPALPQQHRIAEILSTVDEAIEQTEALIAKTQQIKAALMHDLFTRGVTADGQIRPPREEAPQLYKESPLGWIPKEWDVAVVDDFCSQVVDCPHSTPAYVDCGIPCIRTADMLPGQLLLDQAYRVTEKTYWERVARLVPRDGDIIYSREGERLGIASPVGDEPVCLGQRVMLLRPGQDNDPSFMLWGMNTAWFYRRVVSGLGATTSPHVNVGDIRNQLLLRPSRDEQERIGLQLTTTQAKLAADETEVRQFQALRSGLMSDLLTGRVHVTIESVLEPKEVAANV
ncbi:MAG: hypothetical protein Tsb002_01320 [Wenzhouxiangellaceae bacterium]